VVDVDELHTLVYETNSVIVEEEQNPVQEVGSMEEDPERSEYDNSRGQGKRQIKQATGSAPQSHELEIAQVAVHKGVIEVGASSSPTKRKGKDESNAHRGSQPQGEGTLILPKIPSEVRVDDDMVDGVTSIKYSDHDMTNVTKFLDLASQVYLERKGAGASGMPQIESAHWIMGLYNKGIMNFLNAPHFGRGNLVNSCVKKLLA
jgi:hypothetical protein